MLKPPRWEAEIRLMLRNFPTFKPFAVPGREAGFYGYLLGHRTGTTYRVVIRTPLSDYPQKEPGVYMDPHPERHHWISDNRLCYQRAGDAWNPAKHTFAQALGFAVKYVAEFDGT
jgi:hypothetical protein